MSERRLPPDASGVFAFLVSFCSVLRKMDWVSLHLCFLFCHFLWGGRSASPTDALGVFACVVFFFRHFCLLLLVFFLPDVLGSNVPVRGGNLKQKKAGGGLGGGRSASPPDALGVFACVVFFVVIFCLLLLVFFSS